MFLLDWFYGVLALLGLRQKLAKIFFLGLDKADNSKFLPLKDEMEQPSSSLTVPWSDLSPDLLRLVFLRLRTRADRAHFPAVCRQWRSSMRQCHLPPMSPMPWSVLPEGNARFSPYQTLHLPDASRYHNSCGEWLLLSQDDISCFILNPFTNATVQLPSLSSYISYGEHIETVNIPDDERAATWMDIKDPTEISVIKLIVCSKHLIAAIVAIDGLGTIALCRPGDAAWSVSAHEQCMWLSDMVFFQGKLYVVETNEGLLSIDIVDELDNDRPRVSRIERIIKGEPQSPQSYPKSMLYLLESHGTLLMVRRKMNSRRYMVDMYGTKSFVRHSVGSSEFQVLEADLKCLLWAEVRSLGNEVALFIGQGCSSVVHVSPYDMSRDCIFFMDDFTGYTYGMCWRRTYCCLYDMKDGMVYSFLRMISWYRRSERGSGYIPATWLFSEGKDGEVANKRGTSPMLMDLWFPELTVKTK